MDSGVYLACIKKVKHLSCGHSKFHGDWSILEIIYSLNFDDKELIYRQVIPSWEIEELISANNAKEAGKWWWLEKHTCFVFVKEGGDSSELISIK